jgi:hypothetical protein
MPIIDYELSQTLTQEEQDALMKWLKEEKEKNAN